MSSPIRTDKQQQRDIVKCTLRFQAHYGYLLQDIVITTLRGRYIATGLLLDKVIKEVFYHSDPFLSLAENCGNHSSSDSDADSIVLAVCCDSNCHDIGPLGTLCTSNTCLDSGNIYADKYNPESD